MPQQQENLEEQEELDLAEQLDALLVQLQELEPDLLSGLDEAEPMPVVESPPQADMPPESAAAVQESGTGQSAAPISDEASSTDLPSDSDLSDTLPSSATGDPSPQDATEQSADPMEESVKEQSEELLGEALDNILAQAVASELNALESEEEVQPTVIEDATADTETADADGDAGGDVDLVDQLQALLNSQDAADPMPQSDPSQQEVQAQQIVEEPANDAIPVADDVDTSIDELSMEQIDQLLAEESVDSQAEDELEGLVEVSPEAAVQDQPASSVAAMQEEAVGPVESDEVAVADGTSNTAEGGSGFDADAEAVARELDDQPELKARPIASAAPKADEPGRTSRARFRLDKQKLVDCAMVGERLLRRLCTAINSPVRQLHPSIRDAIGVAAVFHLLVGSVLILGKLVGAI